MLEALVGAAIMFVGVVTGWTASTATNKQFREETDSEPVSIYRAIDED